MAQAKTKYVDPNDPLKREFVPGSKVEETRFRAQGYKQVKEKRQNKASAPESNK